MIKLIYRMRDNRRLATAMLLLSTLVFMLASALWRGGAADGALAALLCPCCCCWRWRAAGCAVGAFTKTTKIKRLLKTAA
ncbi:Uncharacterised protein [Chromobacterium violaceum]|uniref:Uncharacterized protein n=1 Tax=Chromobacterium violaceum TaxID=536 RepID=A0A3S4HQN4_CHRVL|nr:Uncharacterised protein [Chromobacterium violaceum]